jgi:broad specificity phosphatase PhoE
MRHLQAESGTDPALTSKGAAEARLLAGWFRRSDRPRAIFVSRFRRAQDTAAPLAAAAGVTPVIYDPSDTPGLVRAVKAQTGSVLVVGHSNTIPDIVEQLGGTRPAPIAHDQHGDIWRVSARVGTTEMLQLTHPPTRQGVKGRRKKRSPPAS